MWWISPLCLKDMPLILGRDDFLRVLVSSMRVSSPSPRTITSISGYAFRLSWAVVVKCCPPATVRMFGLTFLAVSRVLAATYVLHVARALEATMSGLKVSMRFSSPFQSICWALQSSTSISASLTLFSRYAASWRIPYGGGRYSPMTNQ